MYSKSALAGLTICKSALAGLTWKCELCNIANICNSAIKLDKPDMAQ